MQKFKRQFLNFNYNNWEQKSQKNIQQEQTTFLNREDIKKDEIISEHIVEKIKIFSLIIGDLKANLEDKDNKKYWQKIGKKIRFEIVKNLSKNNVVKLTNNKENFFIIFDPQQFFISKDPENQDWDQENNSFKLHGYYLDHKIETIFKLKTTNFNDEDILQYLEQKIASDLYFNFEIDNFNIDYSQMWIEQILKKLKFSESSIIINDQAVAINNDFLKVLWIDLLKIRNNQITFNLCYGQASTIIKVETQYFLSSYELIAQSIKIIVDLYFEKESLYFENYHPFTPSVMIIDQRLFNFIKQNLKLNSLNLTIFIDDFSLKWKGDNKTISPFLQLAEIDFYFKNFFIRKLFYFFPNYLAYKDIDILKKNIEDKCLLDISLIDFDPVNRDLKEMVIADQIYSQISEAEIKIGYFYYKISDIYEKDDFQVTTLILPNDTFANDFMIILMKMSDIHKEKNIERFFSVNVRFQKIATDDFSQKLNDIFQDKYLLDHEKNAIDCQSVYGCYDILDQSQAEVIQNDNVVFEKWKKIMGLRKFILKDFGTIEIKHFVTHAAVLHHFSEGDEELSQYGAEIKKYLHHDATKYNCVMLHLQIENVHFSEKTALDDLRPKFIFPLLKEYKNKR